MANIQNIKITNKKLKGIDNLEEEIANITDIKQLLGSEGLVKRLVKQTVEKLLEAEMTNHLGYEKHDNVGDSIGNSRNGYSPKKLRNEHGAIDIAVPRDRNADFEPKIIPKYSHDIDDAFDAKVVSMYGFGMSVADINKHLNDLYGLTISESEISSITDQILPLIEEYKTRPLERVYLITYIDGIWFKVREEGHIEKKCLYNMIGITQDGRKEVLGMYYAKTESASMWAKFLTDIKGRGVEDILIACMDGLVGLPDAFKAVFPDTKIQNCIVHQIRNTLKFIKEADKDAFIKDLKTVYGAIDESGAMNELVRVQEKYPAYSHALKGWETNWENLTTYFAFPQEIRKLIYTTNAIESFHAQIRKYTKTKRVFPTQNSLEKLVYLVVERIEEKWNMPIQNFKQILAQLQIYFEGRC